MENCGIGDDRPRLCFVFVHKLQIFAYKRLEFLVRSISRDEYVLSYFYYGAEQTLGMHA